MLSQLALRKSTFAYHLLWAEVWVIGVGWGLLYWSIIIVGRICMVIRCDLGSTNLATQFWRAGVQQEQPLGRGLWDCGLPFGTVLLELCDLGRGSPSAITHLPWLASWELHNLAPAGGLGDSQLEIAGDGSKGCLGSDHAINWLLFLSFDAIKIVNSFTQYTFLSPYSNGGRANNSSNKQKSINVKIQQLSVVFVELLFAHFWSTMLGLVFSHHWAQ